MHVRANLKDICRVQVPRLNLKLRKVPSAWHLRESVATIFVRWGQEGSGLTRRIILVRCCEVRIAVTRHQRRPEQAPSVNARAKSVAIERRTQSFPDAQCRSNKPWALALSRFCSVHSQTQGSLPAAPSSNRSPLASTVTTALWE